MANYEQMKFMKWENMEWKVTNINLHSIGMNNILEVGKYTPLKRIQLFIDLTIWVENMMTHVHSHILLAASEIHF